MNLEYYPSPKLIKICKNVHTRLPKERAAIASRMWAIMKKHKGIGLSANQVGMDIRMFVWLERGCPLAIWNPVLSCLSGSNEAKEGCLSLPGITVSVCRKTNSILHGQGINGLPLQFVGNLIMTRIWQHEIDHLDGRLIIDNMNESEKIINEKALTKLINNSVT